MSSTSKKKKSTQNEIIELDKQIINAQILKNGKYEKNGALIRKWEGETDSDSYIAQITKSNMSFIGILNGKFEREGYGLNNFSNGDQYFGYYENNQRNRHGIYFFSEDSKNKFHVCFLNHFQNNQNIDLHLKNYLIHILLFQIYHLIFL